MCQNDIGILDLLVPRGADKAFIVEGGKRAEKLVDVQVALADKNCASVFHIAEAYIFDISAKGLDSCLGCFARAEICSAHVPGGADDGGCKMIYDSKDVFGV